MSTKGDNLSLYSSFREVVGFVYHLRSGTNLQIYFSFPRPTEAENKAGGVWLKGHTGNYL